MATTFVDYTGDGNPRKIKKNVPLDLQEIQKQGNVFNYQSDLNNFK